MNRYSRCGNPRKASSSIRSNELAVNKSSCRAGVWTKLPADISLNPDLTKDRETTSVGKVCGTDRTFSHRALSLVQEHPMGHLGCLSLRPSDETKHKAATQTRSVHPSLHLFPGYPIAFLSTLLRTSTAWYPLYKSFTCNFFNKNRSSKMFSGRLFFFF